MGRVARVVLAAALFLTITPVLTASAIDADTPADLPALPSIPTLDPEIWRRTEPGTAPPHQRLRALERIL